MNGRVLGIGCWVSGVGIPSWEGQGWVSRVLGVGCRVLVEEFQPETHNLKPENQNLKPENQNLKPKT